MILSRKLSDALNEQINMEMWSSNLYLSMSVHFTQIGLDGFAHWTLKQSQEELEHAYKMIDYSIKRGGQVTIGVVNSVLVEASAETAEFAVLLVLLSLSALPAQPASMPQSITAARLAANALRCIIPYAPLLSFSWIRVAKVVAISFSLSASNISTSCA